jgi:ACS family hexuronate transporter-like MFS transporter
MLAARMSPIPSADPFTFPPSAIGLSRRQAWALTLVATFTMAVSYIDRQTLSVIAPTVQAQLGIDDVAYGWLVSAFSIAYLVGAPIAGRVIDRVGARRGLLVAVLVWSGVAALHTLVPGFGVLFGLRIALGIAESPSFPGAAQTIHRALPPKDRPRALGVLFSGSSVGAMIAPLLATWLTAHFGWRFAFAGTALVGLVWVPIWLYVTRTPEARAALDRPEIEAETPTASAPDAGSPGPRAPLGPLALLTHPAVLRAVLVVLATAPLLSFYFNWSAKYLVHDWHLAQADLAKYLWFPPLFFDAGAILFGHSASRALARGEPGVPRSLVAMATALMMTSFVAPFAASPLAVLLLASVSLSGGGGLYALATTEMMARVPSSQVSAAGGLTAAAQSLAYIIASPLIGRSVQASGNYTPAFLALTAWVIPGCAAWLLWRQAPSPRSAIPADRAA